MVSPAQRAARRAAAVIATLAALQMAAAVFLMSTGYAEDHHDAGSCCLPRECDVSQLPARHSLVLDAGSTCTPTASEAVAMGCVKELAEMATCNITNAGLCARPAPKSHNLAAGVAVQLGSGMLLMGVAWMLVQVWFRDHGNQTLISIDSKVRKWGAGLWILGVTVGFVGFLLAVFSVAAHPPGEVNYAPARKCEAWATNQDGHCSMYTSAGFEGNGCLLAGQPANVATWSVWSPAATISVAIALGLPGAEFLLTMAMLLLRCRAVCAWCNCRKDNMDDDFDKYGYYHSRSDATGVSHATLNADHFLLANDESSTAVSPTGKSERSFYGGV